MGPTSPTVPLPSLYDAWFPRYLTLDLLVSAEVRVRVRVRFRVRVRVRQTVALRPLGLGLPPHF